MSIRALVIDQFERVAQEHNKLLAPLSDELDLQGTGLDSLCFAIVAVRLEEAVGADPFDGVEVAKLPVTVGDFIKFYENATR